MGDSSSIKPGFQHDIKNRIFVFGIIIAVILIILILKIGYIQIIKNPVFKEQSATYREKVIRIPPIRGRIMSSDGKIFADSIVSYNIYLNPNELQKDLELRQKKLLYLAKVLNLDYFEIEKVIQKNPKTKDDILLADNVSFDIFTKIKENYENLKGITIKEELVRNYPNKKYLSHVLGYIGPIDSNELSILTQEDYLFSDLIGKNGIEKSYEKELRGVAGKLVYEMDARMNVQKEVFAREVKAQPGNELILTINYDLQKNVEDILADRTGSIVVLKPSTGEVLAMASYPNYDPNIYILQNPENDEMKKQIALDTKGTPLINRAIQAVYPPGSVFKLITTTAILQENIVSTDKTYFCSGVYRVGNETFGCWVRPGQHGWQNLAEAVMNSCDVYFYNVCQVVGPDRIGQYARSFGFGNSLGIDIPYESSGLIPTIQWKKSNNETWHLGDTLNTVIGQGDVKVTPLQIANFFSALCNKGYAYKPHLLKQVKSPIDDKVIKEVKPERIINLNLKDETFAFIHNALRRVTTEGTGGRAFAPNKLKFAGKTGTAEVGMGQKKSTHSWFAGFGPVDYPLDEQIVVVVLCEYENNSYNRFAAPIASMVFSSYFMKEDYITTAKRLYYPIKDSYSEQR
jgi:penicillin-binding protein 2